MRSLRIMSSGGLSCCSAVCVSRNYVVSRIVGRLVDDELESI